MNWIPVNHFNLLKNEITRVADLTRVTPGDCRRLSVDIQKKTNKRISETTLKRIYGFASTRFNPSSFTLNALSEYCGFKSWEDFIRDIAPDDTKKPERYWSKLGDEAVRITSYTLQLLKNRSGIPYSRTIGRRFLNDHLAIFLNENFRGTVITAPSGYGKTIALCHWVEDFIRKNEEAEEKDLLLFISGSVLINGVNGFQEVSEWITAFSGLSSNDLYMKLPEFMESYGGRFFLVIDGLDNHFNHHQFNTLLIQLNELATFYRDNDRIKIIITMRTFNWNAVRTTISEANGWFSGFMIGQAAERNVPLLDYYEIFKITGHNNLQALDEDQLHTLEVLCFPLYLQYFYDHNSGHFLIENINELSMYELISTHVYHRIYMSNNSNEIMLLLDELIANMDLQNGVYHVNKLGMAQSIKKHSKAYHELLDIGFLLESNESNAFRYTLNILFANQAFLSLAVAKRILFMNNERFDENLVASLNEQLSQSLKHETIKWCIFLTIGNRMTFPVRLLEAFELTIQQKLDIAGFLDHLFRKQQQVEPELLSSLVTDISIAHFFGMGIIQAGYTKSLDTVLSLQIPGNEKVMMRTCLAIVALTALDLDRVDAELKELSKFSDAELSEYRINPYNCLRAANYFLKHGIVIKELHNEVNKVALDSARQKAVPDSFNEVLNLLLLRVLLVCQMPDIALRCHENLAGVYANGSDTYHFMLGTMRGEALLATGHEHAVAAICKNLEAAVGAKSGRTEYMDITLQALRLKLIALSTLPDRGELTDVQRRCENRSFHYIKASLQYFILKRCKELTEQDRQLLYYDLVKQLRKSGVRVESFGDV